MAQLRDARSSALIFEGTPLEVALLAEELGRDEVLFDDVGLAFDPDAVLEGARQSAETVEGEAGAEARAALELPEHAAAKATEALEAARERMRLDSPGG